ncbi:exosortase A [Sulfurimicrobium lacus]|uniref:Exosortase A n=1 Tax=Sulfurimicrobium lacus TaxID=2715678 RepID=A0A6F8VAA4_9PROT|nr:exosortase A [Sulfurimicrobium lacus]BCB26594.1 exosortase A [Sulfurimicrobium lacus]
MKENNSPVITASAPAQSATPVMSWGMAAILTFATIAAILAIYQQTALSTIAIWQRSETFAHGFLIFPISLYLVWTQRSTLASITPRPDFRGLAVLAGLGFGWLFSDAGSVLVIAQYCLVAMIPVAVWTLLGAPVARAIAFPLGFLFFAVPAGEFLVPHMMNFTADFVVAALRLTGIPVYREGTFFTIPSGQWSVVEACSGLRYLIASFTLGSLYAYLTYRSTSRRLVFAALSLVVPLIANGMRAYMIVMIAHLSNMKLALGVDHLIYGWVFFGIVMMLLFWVGAFWREDQKDHRHNESISSPGKFDTQIPSRAFFVASIAFIAVAALWPAYSTYLDSRPVKTTGLSIELPDSANGWVKQSKPLSDWQPHYIGPDAYVMQTYRKNGMVVSVYVGYYRTQRKGAELITSQNYMIMQTHPVWSNVGEAQRAISLHGKNETIQQTLLRAPAQRLLVWNWNSLGDTYTVNPYLAKLLLAKERMLGQQDDGAAIIIAAPYEDTPEPAAAALRAFIQDMLPAIRESIVKVSQQQAAAGS